MRFGVSLFVIAMSLFAQVVLFASELASDDRPRTVAILVLTCFGFAGFVVARKRSSVRGKLFSISTLFLLSFVIVGLQVPVSDLLGYRVLPQFHQYMWTSSDVEGKAVALVCMGFVAFLLGWTATRPHVAVGRRCPEVRKTTHELASWLLFGAATFSYGIFLAGSGSFVRGEYTPDDASSLISYFYKIFKIALTAAVVHRIWLIVMDSSESIRLPTYLRGLGWPLIFLLLFHCVLLVWVGDRGPFIYFVLLVLGPFIIRFYSRSQLWLIGCLAVAATLLSVIGEVRQARFSGDSYSERLAIVATEGRVFASAHPFYGGSVPFASTMELAGSFRTITHAVDFVPTHHPHMWGYFSFMNFVAVVPGLSGGLSSILFKNDEMYAGSANFVTRVIQGPSPKYGEGTSVVAELYIDFGPYGVVIGLLLFGSFVRVMEAELISGGQRFSLLWVASMSFFANSIYLARSSLGGELANVLFSYVLVLFALKLAKLGTRSRW